MFSLSPLIDSIFRLVRLDDDVCGDVAANTGGHGRGRSATPPSFTMSTMTSAFGWVATDAEQRRQMAEIVDHFRDSTTIDDLGLGGIRDAFSDTLFPGTSTLHTRIRYALFIPWLMQLAADRRSSVTQMSAAFTRSEFQLTRSLLNGGEVTGVIGRVAGADLQRTASVVYWGMLVRWGVITPGLTLRKYFDRVLLRRLQAERDPRADDPEALADQTPTDLHEGLPTAPPDLLTTTDFTLRSEDARFLRESITFSAPDSLLAHLVQNQPEGWTHADSAPESFASPMITTDLPLELHDEVTRAERYAVGIHGVNLLYNLILAHRTGLEMEDGVSFEEHYEAWIREWFDEARTVGVPIAEDLQQIWTMVSSTGRVLSRSTRSFVAGWFAAVEDARTADDLINSSTLHVRVADREQEKKGPRARLNPSNRQALDAWTGAAGTGRNTFRWHIVRDYLQDLYDAETAD